jgi:hypothetical protein
MARIDALDPRSVSTVQYSRNGGVGPVTLVRQGYEAFNRGEGDAVLALPGR